ncbi:MAG: hypothetical protein AAF268_02270 [Cyanobacteria bacterium P01_A01_bin.3]
MSIHSQCLEITETGMNQLSPEKHMCEPSHRCDYYVNCSTLAIAATHDTEL